MSPPDNRFSIGITRPPPLPGALGRLAARVYGAVVARRNRRFDTGRGVVTLDRPVISVGNLSVGGTGKTPMVARLVRLLLDAGHVPCIAMRGYASPTGRGEDSDEARAYAMDFPDVPIAANPNRLDALLDLFDTPRGETVDCVVLDDGFQHRRLARQCDIVLLDATRSPFDDALLPAGWLREPVASLARAHATVLTHADRVPEARAAEVLRRAGEIAPKAVRAACVHEWLGLRRFEGDREDDTGLDALRGRRVVAACAIGNPGPFLEAAANAVGGSLAGSLVLRDHDPYAPATLERLARLLDESRAEALLVTQKDWTKLAGAPAARLGRPVCVPRLGLRFTQGADDLDALVLATAGLDPDSL